tara:strand:- start:885 stop:1487 length:603 start_codon:yes stop_codon:yes gene_type:complete
MSKRKIENTNIEKKNNNINIVENIFIIDNHIYFNGIIDDINLLLLKSKINHYIIENGNIQNHMDSIVDLNNCIVIHINSVGGYIDSLIKNLDIFSKRVKIVTIIENRVCDCGLLFAAVSAKRYIKQQARVVLRGVYNNYWYLFKQCDIENINKFNENLIELFKLATNNKLKQDHIQELIKTSHEFTPKKIKRLHFIDEII